MVSWGRIGSVLGLWIGHNYLLSPTDHLKFENSYTVHGYATIVCYSVCQYFTVGKR